MEKYNSTKISYFKKFDNIKIKNLSKNNVSFIFQNDLKLLEKRKMNLEVKLFYIIFFRKI